MLNIFITNLEKYNEGVLVGEWLRLPATEEKINATLEKIGINERYEEFFITDFETDIKGLQVGEYNDLDELNELAEVIEEDPEIAEALIYWGYDTAEEIRENLDNVYTIENDGINEDYNIGWYYAKECGCLNIPEEIENYFDFEAYGRDIRMEGQFYITMDAIYELAA